VNALPAMNESMREGLKRRRRWFVASFCVCLALLLFPLIPGFLILLRQRDPYGLRHYGELTVFIGACMLSVARLKCPKCRRPLSPRVVWPRVPACCPRCGVNFDEPMPPGPISPIAR
jgi:hypothetical protein